VVHTEEQKQAVARPSVLGAHQWGMLMRTPLMKAEQDRAIRVTKLAEVVMGGARQRLAEEGLVPFEATSDVPYADDRPRAFHAAHDTCGYFAIRICTSARIERLADRRRSGR